MNMEQDNVRQVNVKHALDQFKNLFNFRRKFRVLMVEDDACMKPLMARIFYSYKPNVDLRWVTSLTDGKQALLEEEFDLIVTDYLLSDGPHGIELRRLTKLIQPKARVLLVSGYSLKILEKDSGVSLQEVSFLQKPFRVSECFEALHGLSSIGVSK